MIGGTINAAIPVVLMPILTRYLTPTDYGIVGTSTVIMQILTVILGINAFGLIGRSQFDNDFTSQQKLVSTSIILACLLSVLLIVVLIPTRGLVENVTKFPASWIPILVVISLGSVIQATFISLVQAKQEPVLYSKIQISATILNLGLSLFFVVAIGMNWQGRMLAILISGAAIALFGLYGLTMSFGLFRLEFDMNSLRKLLSFGIPLIPHFIGGWVMTMVSRLYLNNMASVADTGLYSVGFNIASPIAMVVGAANQAYWPSLFDKLSNPHVNKLKLARILLLGAASLPVLALSYGMAAYWFLPFIVGPRFYNAAHYVLWLSLAFAMQGVYFIFGSFVVYSKRTSLMAWRADFLGGIAMLALCPLLIYADGPIGAAQATLLAFLISTIGCFTASRKAYPMPWKNAALSFVSFNSNPG